MNGSNTRSDFSAGSKLRKHHHRGLFFLLYYQVLKGKRWTRVIKQTAAIRQLNLKKIKQNVRQQDVSTRWVVTVKWKVPPKKGFFKERKRAATAGVKQVVPATSWRSYTKRVLKKRLYVNISGPSCWRVLKALPAPRRKAAKAYAREV